MLQRVAVCCSVLQCVAVFVLCAAVSFNIMSYRFQRVAACCSVLQCVVLCAVVSFNIMTYRKRDIRKSKETCINVKRDLKICLKRPLIS